MSSRRSNDSRRSSEQPPPGPTNPNVFDDMYALDQSEEDEILPVPVADGFRPPPGLGARTSTDSPRASCDRPTSPRPPLSTNQSADSNDLRRLASHNSIAKVPYGRDSIDARSTGAGTQFARWPSSGPAAHPRRRASASSNISFSTMGASEEPSHHGPSHPYGMYTQDPLARSASVTTTSTTRQRQSAQGPSHPYALYPQNVMVDMPNTPPVPQTIPLGFPGHHAAGYHRQVGPDGEEQDIIGPDGHTEQLPPYSRYPDEGPTKASLAAQESAAPPAPAPMLPPILTYTAHQDSTQHNGSLQPPLQPSPVSPLSPAEPFPPPPEDEIAPVSPITPAASTNAALSASEQGVFEKADTAKKPATWRDKKLFGKIPIVMFVILVLLFVIAAVALGATLGILLGRKEDKGNGTSAADDGSKHETPSPQVTGPTNTLFDAKPIATPTGLPRIPTGGFALPLGVPQESQNNCLMNQGAAWSCQMTFAPLVLSINYTKEDKPEPIASVALPVTVQEQSSFYQYGVQPPELGTRPMQLVSDMDLEKYGPAYHFSTSYDKLVILSEDEILFPDSSSPIKREAEKPNFKHRFQVRPGDFPWFCWFNETYIEGYVYVKNNSTAASFSNFQTSEPTSSPVEPTASGSAATPVETGTGPDDFDSMSSTTSKDSPTASSTPSTTAMPIIPRDTESDKSTRLVPYPRIVKIEERRLPDTPTPYCQRMHLLENGVLSPYYKPDNSGYDIRYLREISPSLADFHKSDDIEDGDEDDTKSPEKDTRNAALARAVKRRAARLAARGDPSEACHCQWMFQ